MKKINIIIIFIIIAIGLHAQEKCISIGKNGEKANSKSILDIVSNDKGVLIPRMTTNERLNIFSVLDSTAIGLLLYDLDLKSYMVWGGSSWFKLKQQKIDEKFKMEDQKLVFVNSVGSEISVGIEDIVKKGLLDGSISASKLLAELGKEDQVLSLNANLELIWVDLEKIAIEEESIVTNHIKNKVVTHEKLAEKSVKTININETSIVHSKLADDAVDSLNIADNAIRTIHIKEDGIVSDKIKDKAITHENLAENSIKTINIEDAVITHSKLAENAVDSLNIVYNAIRSLHIKDGAIIASKIANKSITGGKITDNSLTVSNLGENCVGNYELASNAVLSEHIKDGAVKTYHIPDNAITEYQLADSCITSSKIKNASIEAAHLNSISITNYELGIDAVHSSNIKENSIYAEDIALNTIKGDNLYYMAAEISIGASSPTYIDLSSYFSVKYVKENGIYNLYLYNKSEKMCDIRVLTMFYFSYSLRKNILYEGDNVGKNTTGPFIFQEIGNRMSALTRITYLTDSGIEYMGLLHIECQESYISFAFQEIVRP